MHNVCVWQCLNWRPVNTHAESVTKHSIFTVNKFNQWRTCISNFFGSWSCQYRRILQRELSSSVFCLILKKIINIWHFSTGYKHTPWLSSSCNILKWYSALRNISLWFFILNYRYATFITVIERYNFSSSQLCRWQLFMILSILIALSHVSRDRH
jgi:hypothetical protein